MPKLVVISGAGLSAESGLATFRGGDGLWNGWHIDQVCNYNTWRVNRHAVHQFYNERRVELARVEPNKAHLKLAEWQKKYNTVYLTQNIDDLLEKAGCQDVVHLHGRLTEMQCLACGHVWDVGYDTWDCDNQRCPRTRHRGSCGSLRGVKPNVRLFNEICPLYRTLYKTVNDLKPEDVVLVVGTSAAVLPIHVMLMHKPGFKIINCLEETTATSGWRDSNVFDLGIYEPATSALEGLDKFLGERFG